MCTVERETRQQVVVKLPRIPVDRVVARLASVIESVLVRIIVGMTIHTGGRRFLEDPGFVTAVAARVSMAAQ